MQTYKDRSDLPACTCFVSKVSSSSKVSPQSGTTQPVPPIMRLCIAHSPTSFAHGERSEISDVPGWYRRKLTGKIKKKRDLTQDPPKQAAGGWLVAKGILQLRLQCAALGQASIGCEECGT